MKSCKLSYGVILSLLLGAVSIHSVTAADKIKDEVKYRQSAMMFMRWNMGIIKQQVIKSPESFKQDEVLAASRVIEAVAGSGLNKLFHQESLGVTGWKQSRLKQEYFEQSVKAAKLAEEFKGQANKLVLAAEAGEPAAIKRQFDEVFESCRSCHKAFRSK